MAHAGFRLCAKYDGVPSAYLPTTVKCAQSAVGRYVYIYLRKRDHLHLAEVEVYGIGK